MVARRLFYVMILVVLLAGCAGRTPPALPIASGAHVSADASGAHCAGSYHHRRSDCGAHDRAHRGQGDGDASSSSVPGRNGQHGDAPRRQESCNGCAASAEPDRRHTAR